MRWHRRTTLADIPQVDARVLARQGMVHPGQCGILTWGRGDCLTGVVWYALQDAVLLLTYPAREGPEVGPPVTQVLTLARTPCHYGGSRPWFVCPQCARRVAVLAWGGCLFLCCHCARLPYASQCATPR